MPLDNNKIKQVPYGLGNLGNLGNVTYFENIKNPQDPLISGDISRIED